MNPTFGMFGIYRWFLAIMVLLTHLGPPGHFQGHRAVFALFMLSGYVITYILDTQYLHIKQGILKFYLNRALRVYPTYWTVVLISIPVAAYFPQVAHHFAIVMPANSYDWIKNITIFGITRMDGAHPFTLVSLGWSLAVEMTWWVFLPFIVRIGFLRTLFVLAALLFQRRVLPSGMGAPMGFSSAPFAAMMPFALGMLIYLRKKKKGSLPFSRKAFISIFCLLFLIFYFDLRIFYAMILNTGVLYYLSCIETSKISPRLASIDRFLGNLAYPVFLIHLFCAAVLIILFPQLKGFTWSLFLAGFICSNILAVILFYGVEYPVNFLRRRIKYRQEKTV